MKTNKLVFYFLLLLGLGLVVSCSDDDEATPDDNEEEEVISQVVLTFTPETSSLDEVTATWFDADGEGSGAPTIDGIELVEGETYTLSMTLTNTLGTEDEDITAEIAEEDDEHQFFFSFTEGIFADPAGNGNVDNADDPINYDDADDNGLPVGLATTWTAGAHTEATGEFNVVLKHQPDEKSATSDATVGGTDIDITFPLDIVEDPNEEEETITEVVLTFTPAAGGSDIVVTWFDADGEGVGNPTIEDIVLAANTEYDMSITLANTLEDPEEDITEEIAEEDDEHQFFFEFTADIFSSPMGNGNFDTGSDALNYNDQDANGLPVGLSTNWTTGGANSGTFRVVLKHQPELKTSTSDATIGGTDINIVFDISIQ